MAIRILFPHHWQTQAWKNGGGITHELDRVDDEHGLRWRLSIAEIASDGPFSLFANTDRMILMLTGNGFRLHGVGADPEVIDQPLQPFAFPGEAAVQCTLIDGPVRDFNLMSRRGCIAGRLDVYALGAERLVQVLAAQTRLFVVTGTVLVEVDGHGHQLGEQQMLVMDGESGLLQISATSPSAQVLLIRLTPVD